MATKLKQPAICVRGFRSAVKSDPSMPIDMIIDHANKVCSGKLADYDNNKYTRVDSMITLKPFKANSNMYKPYIKSATKDLVDVCRKTRCIPGKSKRCISKKNFLTFNNDQVEKICYGERALNPTVAELANTLQNLIKYYVVSNESIIGIIDTMNHFNIVKPEISRLDKSANILNV